MEFANKLTKVLVMLFVWSVAVKGLPHNALGDMKIVCLFNNKHFYRAGFTPKMIEPAYCTHLNYEFAILDPQTFEIMVGVPELDEEKSFYNETRKLKEKNHKLKVLISVGGWEDSTKKYSDMASTKSNRKKFIDSAVSFILGHEFDGMDLAWEYPNCWKGALGVNPKDKDNFSDLLKEIKAAFELRNLILSISVTAIKREIAAAYDVLAISKSVNHINVMTYDMHGPWEGKTGHHAQFSKREKDTDEFCNVKAAIKLWEDAGADKKKLVIGLPLYATTFTLADSHNHSIGARSKGPGKPGPKSNQGGFMSYNEICGFLNSGSWTEEEDKQAGFYAYSADQWVGYDPPMMMVKKAKYVVDNGYGGVMLKDLSSDDYKGDCFSMRFPLLRMIKLEISSAIKQKQRQIKT